MSKTKAKVKEDAAERLGIKTVGQAINPAHSNKLDQYWDAAYDELKDEDINVFSSSGPVPDKVFPWLASMIALHATESFSVSEERYARILRKSGTNNESALRQIRKYAQNEFENISKVTDY